VWAGGDGLARAPEDGLSLLAPAGAGTPARLILVARHPGLSLVGADVDFGDGRGRFVAAPCPDRGGPPGDRPLRVRHVFRRKGTYEVVARPVFAERCGAPRGDVVAGEPSPALVVEVFPSRVTVPRLVGKVTTDAKCALERRGLRWRLNGQRGGHPPFACDTPLRDTDDVGAQRPAAGRRVRPGTIVVLRTCLSQDCL